MAFDIIIGRSEKDREKYGTKGSIFMAKHYVRMGQTVSLSNNIFLDMLRSHVIFVCGKRGSGKSYTMGVMAEGMSDLPSEICNNLSIVIFDTMGVYWTMKFPNKKDALLLKEWNMEPKALEPVIFSPKGLFEQEKAKGIPVDQAFAIRPQDLGADDWLMTFSIKSTEPVGVLIERIIYDFKEQQTEYGIQDIIRAIRNDEESDPNTKSSAMNRFQNALQWGVFDQQGTPISEIAKPGRVSIVDISAYATQSGGWNIKSLVIGLLSQQLFIERMRERKEEEYKDVHKSVNYFSDDDVKQQFPLVWLVVDEAHEFLPNKGKTTATDPLVTILREGRQPGISLVLASQQPGKIHTDVMTQSDIIISHRITAKLDTDALGSLVQSYMRTGLDAFINELPREKGAAVILDDNNERMYPVRIRPRFTWHGGESPTAMAKKKDDYFSQEVKSFSEINSNSDFKF
ncbi:ATP-binding protein [Candidatus Woesearchaeota archaeon]|nr:ATP-binding protein [Candidatus Woesearchaeota archaeon]